MHNRALTTKPNYLCRVMLNAYSGVADACGNLNTGNGKLDGKGTGTGKANGKLRKNVHAAWAEMRQLLVLKDFAHENLQG